MPETDILNPVQGFDPDLGDSMCPNYGFTRKRALTALKQKAPGGIQWSRDLDNSGHQFTLSWIGRTLACVTRLKWYGEQYEDGFFTLVDWDAGGRHYVGHFTTEIVPVETNNNKYDVQNVTFEEIPRVPMVQYPGDWDNDAIFFYARNDYGDQKLATSGTWTATARNYGGIARTTMDNPGTTAGDWATYEYRGYGFQLYMLKGPEFGQVQVLLDNNAVATVDLYSAINLGPQKVYEMGQVQLDIHRIKVIVTGNKNAAASAAGASWYSLKVMR